MYCSKCGKEIMDEAIICPGCGCAVKESKKVEDTVNGGLMLLSILIPLAGVILWPVKHKETPKAAMCYGIAGIFSWILWYIVIILVSTMM